ncbi:hypothetical protein ILUMI_13173 [Ignelater luminosus]|uniref:Transmembrane protein 267 n=1 Tax=Ignelater luminosus TaxID=2038154 RepID=A0A8K0CX77_IGNLU|nr:hypothetical protein ILUMI_13173 [Ignelater luminosus]
MLFHEIIFGIHIYLVTLLILVAIIGDYVVQYSKLHIYKAFFDNITHAIIGGLSWLIVCLYFKNRYPLHTLFEIALCTITASFIDLDHFIAARSFNLKDATNLQNRPLLHCSSLLLLLTLSVILIAYFVQIRWLLRLGLIIFIAFTSHHTRDATRRGFWIYPWGSTTPISYVLYIILTILIPYFVCLVMHYIDITERQNEYIRIV